MKTIFLDFDGVLFDTVLESYLLARYAYFNIEPKEVVDEVEYNLFHSVRYLVTHSWHYYYIMKLIQNGTGLINFYKEYKVLIINRNEQFDSKFDIKFQAKRKDLIQNSYNFWSNLDKPYPFLTKIKSLTNNYNILIVSTKNEEAITQHCKDYGLDIEEKNIIGKTKLKQYGSKVNFMDNYLKNHDIKRAIFIDDSIETIKQCSNIQNLKAYCANWGYVANKNMGLSDDKILKIIEEL